MPGTVGEIHRPGVINAVAPWWIRGHVALESVWRVSVGIEVIVGRVIGRGCRPCRWDGGRRQEHGQWCASRVEIADVITPELHGQLRSTSAEITDFHCRASRQFVLHAETPGQDLRHDRVIDVAGCKAPRVHLRCRRNQSSRQSASGKKSGAYGGGIAPSWFVREGAGRIRVDFALDLGWQSNRREVLELHVVRNTEPSPNCSLAASRWVVRETHAGTDVVAIRFGHSKGNYAWNVRNGVDGLLVASHRIGPKFITRTKIQGQPGSDFDVILHIGRKQALRSQETSGTCTTQSPARLAGKLVVNEFLQVRVPVVTVTARKKE